MTKIIAVLFLLSPSAWAVRPDLKTLPIGLAAQERRQIRPMAEPPKPGALPMGPIHSLGEWEDSDAVLTLWTNPAYIKALSENGKVRLLADDRSSESWWKNWLTTKGISTAPFSYYTVPTDSIWIRDYGPFWIVDGNGKLASVDTVYNRPRPKDDKVPAFIAGQMGIQNYSPGLVHTGGNYYSDGTGNAFSSTLVYKENSSLTQVEVQKRMTDFLGISRYTTTPLGEKVTIEHLDTFGKLVAPDTWVIADFASGTFKKDADTLVDLLKKQESPYGTPYRIFRLKMVGVGSNYRAYINSFISNRVLYFPSYGDNVDQEVAQIYQSALPGYKIVPVENGNTWWGDSIHCRSRNQISKKAIFIFPKVKKGFVVEARIFASQDSILQENPKLVWAVDGKISGTIEMKNRDDSPGLFVGELPRLANGKLTFYIEAKDSSGRTKRAPPNAPARGIEVN